MDLTALNQDRKSKRKNTVDLSTMMYGKVPPQAKDLEDAVLGAIMLEVNAFEAISDFMRPECFYVEAHQRIYRAMMSMSQRGAPIDVLTVVEELRVREELDLVGGPYYVTKLTNQVVSAANIEYHARIIFRKWFGREMIRISGETIGDAYDDSVDVYKLIDEHEKKLTELSASHLQKTFTPINDGLVEAITRIEELRKSPNVITGVSSGFSSMDAITHGWQPGDLIILAARPSVGKTAFALNLARNAALNADKPVPVGFFSLEMSRLQLIHRLLSAESEIWIEKITNGNLDEQLMKQLYDKAVYRLTEAKMFIDDRAALDIYAMRSRARAMKRRHNIGFLLVDYLQLMSGTNERGGNREQEISKISRDLKALAKELDVPIIALSQLSRKPEDRKGDQKMPVLSDLRESGAIEQDADVVMFMYRPEYYDITATEMGESTKGETHIKIAKHRNGRLDTIKLRADLAIQKFFHWDSLEDVKRSLGQGKWTPVSNLFESDKKDLPFE